MGIRAIYRSFGLALTDADDIVPITVWLDEDGDECAPEDAVAAVAGRDGLGWWPITLDEFTGNPN